MDADITKATSFIARLLSNPAMNNLAPLLKEEQILQFLGLNARQLFPTLSSVAFFPERNWEQIVKILREALYGEINKQLLSGIESLVKYNIDFSFLQFLRQQNMPQEKVKEDFFKFISVLLNKHEIRRDMTGPYNAIQYKIADRYVDQIFARRQYIHFELTKVQRLKMSKEEIKHFIGASLLLKPAIHVLKVDDGSVLRDGSGGSVQAPFIEKVTALLKDKLKVLPEQVIRSGLYANGSFLENRSMDATSRLAATLSSMCKNYRPNITVDRGADSADKSWINVARRNYKFYGYDVKLLDEFYAIAAENGW